MTMEFDEIGEYEISPLEYMIHLGAQGRHPLFEVGLIREAFAKQEDELVCLGSELAEEVRDAVRNVLALSELEDKREYISELPRDVQYVLIHIYFQMIEKTIHLNQTDFH